MHFELIYHGLRLILQTEATSIIGIVLSGINGAVKKCGDSSTLLDISVLVGRPTTFFCGQTIFRTTNTEELNMELDDLDSLNKNDFLPLLSQNIKQELFDPTLCDSPDKQVIQLFPDGMDPQLS